MPRERRAGAPAVAAPGALPVRARCGWSAGTGSTPGTPRSCWNRAMRHVGCGSDAVVTPGETGRAGREDDRDGGRSGGEPM